MEEKRRSYSESLTLGSNNNQGDKYILVFVGLPARGKSYLSRKLANFLRWMGLNSKVFSFGLYRRSLIGTNCDSKFFEDENTETAPLKEKIIYKAIDDMLDFLLIKNGRIGIIDGTNTRKDKRKLIRDYINDKIPSNVRFSLMWIESICKIEHVVESNILKNKLKSPDYKGWMCDKAIKDFRDRICLYEKNYDNLSPENDGENETYIQLIDYNTEIVTRNVKGFLQSKILSYLVNLIPGDRPIYFARDGISENYLKHIIGGDSDLSEEGHAYAKNLFKLFSHEINTNEKLDKENIIIYTSTQKSCTQTAEYLKTIGKIIPFKCLEELQAGICDGLTLNEIKKNYPKEYEERMKDKLHFRYARGECYKDLIIRIEPLIYEIERRQGPVIVLAHESTLRCIYGYFNNTPLENIHNTKIPLNTVIWNVPQAYGFDEKRCKIEDNVESILWQDVELNSTYDDMLYNIPKKKEF